VLAERGELEEAERLLREAGEWASQSDSPMQLGEVAFARARVLERMGRADEAAAEARRAAGFYTRKGMESSAARAEALVASLA
jgi:tetratricopeptide (TPR) repeat protein